MLRPFLRVARPRHYSGTLARVGCGLLMAMLLLWAVVGAVPQAWLGAAFGQAVVLRAILVLAVLWLMGWVRALVYAALPRSVFTVFGRVWFRHKGRRTMLVVRELQEVWVEQRSDPAREVFVVAAEGGAQYDLCPVDWQGAPRLWARLDGALRRARKRTKRSELGAGAATSPPQS